MTFGIGSCPANNGPVVPVIYDFGNAQQTSFYYSPNSRGTLLASIFATVVPRIHPKSGIRLCNFIREGGAEVCNNQIEILKELQCDKCFEYLLNILRLSLPWSTS